MKKLNFALIATLALGSVAWADTVTGSGNSGFSAFSPGAVGVPFWNNPSSDTVNGSTAANVGNFLADTGGFAQNGNVTAGCSACGTNFMASGGQQFTQASNSPNFSTSFNFVRQSGALTLTLLYANSAANTSVEFGIYDATNISTAQGNHVILQSAGTNLNSSLNPGLTYGGATAYSQFTNSVFTGTTTLQNGSPYANWGIYVRECILPTAPNASTCVDNAHIVTQFFNVAWDQNVQAGDAGHQHFALFQAGTNANQFYVGLEDFPSPSNVTEGYGDYNDIIIGINTSQSGVPEPGTLSIMGLGLAGLGLLRRKLKK